MTFRNVRPADVYMGNSGYPNELFLNMGRAGLGKFKTAPASDAANYKTRQGHEIVTTAVAIADFDGNGLDDLYEGNEENHNPGSSKGKRTPNIVYLSRGGAMPSLNPINCASVAKTT